MPTKTGLQRTGKTRKQKFRGKQGKKNIIFLGTQTKNNRLPYILDGECSISPGLSVLPSTSNMIAINPFMNLGPASMNLHKSHEPRRGGVEVNPRPVMPVQTTENTMRATPDRFNPAKDFPSPRTRT